MDKVVEHIDANPLMLYGGALWRFHCVFGEEYTNENRDKSVKEFMNGFEDLFCYSMTDRSFYLTYRSSIDMMKRHTVLVFKNISNIEAFNKFGIDMMEEAREKIYSVCTREDKRLLLERKC